MPQDELTWRRLNHAVSDIDSGRITGDMRRERNHAIGIMAKLTTAKFQLGQIVRHRFFPFRGVIFDVDPEFANTEEWWQSIPAEMRPRKDQPFYHLLAENDETEYVAYV